MIIYLDDRRLQTADLAGKIQHVCGGVPLLMIGVEKIRSGAPDWPIAALEVVLACVVLITFIWDVRQLLRKGHSAGSHAAIGWFDTAVGALLIFEAFHGHHNKPGYLRPLFFAGIVTLALGLFHNRFHGFRQRRRYLKLDETGIEGRLGPFRHLKFAWTDLKSVDAGEQQVVFVNQAGERRTMNLGRLNNSDAVRQAITDHTRAAGLLPAD